MSVLSFFLLRLLFLSREKNTRLVTVKWDNFKGTEKGDSQKQRWHGSYAWVQVVKLDREMMMTLKYYSLYQINFDSFQDLIRYGTLQPCLWNYFFTLLIIYDSFNSSKATSTNTNLLSELSLYLRSSKPLRQ